MILNPSEQYWGDIQKNISEFIDIKQNQDQI